VPVLGKITKGIRIFNVIAPIYGLFYDYQRANYKSILNKAEKELGLAKFSSIIDLGCGTGALCAELEKRNLDVTGVDPAQRMLEIAKKKSRNKSIKFLQASALDRLPFEDKSFDISITSYVAHGLDSADRKILYAEMNRIARHLVVVCDYNKRRSIGADFIESLEGGDYFNFVETGLIEMTEFFHQVEVIDVATQTALYLCVPHDVKKKSEIIVSEAE
jgi:ubiquinone/menaquinone biosynthesis C-methylase UbiE